MLEVDRLLASSADQRRALEELAQRASSILERIRLACARPDREAAGPAIIAAPPSSGRGEKDGLPAGPPTRPRAMAAGRRSRKN